jgi:putative nucleotidyltransferase with HDIG domain
VSKKDLKEIIENTSDLPELPTVLMEVNRLIRKPTITVNEISNLIVKDPALTSRILRMANSSYYGLSYKVATLSKAISVLGFNIIQNLGITVTIFKMFNKCNPALLNIKGLWHHSLGCAIASKFILKKKSRVLQEKAFLSGILHDIGKVIIAENFPEETNKTLTKLREDEFSTQSELEKDFIGYTHSDFGAFIAEKWQFPPELSIAIRFHHNPQIFLDNISGDDDHKDTLCLLLAVHAGNQLAKLLNLGKSSDNKVDIIEDLTWEYLNIDSDNIEEVLMDIRDAFDEVLDDWGLFS